MTCGAHAAAARSAPQVRRVSSRIVRAFVDRAVVGPGGADIRLRVERLAGLVRDLTAAVPEALRAAAEQIERGYLGSLLRLTLLAPDIVEAILDGRQPEGLGLPRLVQPFPTAWDDQPGAAISRRVPCGAAGLPRPALR